MAPREDIEMLSVDEVDCYQSADKYTLASRGDDESVLRMTRRESESSLNPNKFWRVHRNAIVRVVAIARVRSDQRGNPSLELKHSRRRIAVGRSHAYRLQKM